MTDCPFPEFAKSVVPAVTMEEMREVDRIMIEDLNIQLMQMMENAGRNLAEVAIRRFDPSSVLVLAGTGGNGGGGLVAARHLNNRGVGVRVVLAREAGSFSGVPGHQLDVTNRLEIPIEPRPAAADLYIDALIGYSLRGDPSGRAAELIDWLGERNEPVLALDTPSGLDVTSGTAGNPCVVAAATLALAAPKSGLLEAPEVGELFVGDISVPPSVYDAFDLTMPPALFAAAPVVRLR